MSSDAGQLRVRGRLIRSGTARVSTAPMSPPDTRSEYSSRTTSTLSTSPTVIGQTVTRRSTSGSPGRRVTRPAAAAPRRAFRRISSSDARPSSESRMAASRPAKASAVKFMLRDSVAGCRADGVEVAARSPGPRGSATRPRAGHSGCHGTNPRGHRRAALIAGRWHLARSSRPKAFQAVAGRASSGARAGRSRVRTSTSFRPYMQSIASPAITLRFSSAVYPSRRVSPVWTGGGQG